MMNIIQKLDDIVEDVGGIANFILCVIIAGILTAAIMVLFVACAALYFKMT